MNVLICCGARGDVASDYEDAEKLGYVLAQASYGVVYGGGGGMMEAMAAGHVDGGGIPIGFTLDSIARKKAPPANRSINIVATLPQRKALMMSMCEAAIVLPGGLGTLDELFELACASKLGHWSGSIVILNLRGFYDHLLAQLRQATRDGYWNGGGNLTVCDTVAEAISAVGKRGALHASAGQEE